MVIYMRDLDMTALRAFLAVAEEGGVTNFQRLRLGDRVEQGEIFRALLLVVN